MTLKSRVAQQRAAILGILVVFALASFATAQIPLTQISNDPFTNTTSQHETEVEPASYAFGNTIVSTFQEGRFSDGGASDIGFATSTNGGRSWTHGNLPGITSIEGTGTYDRVSDTSVTYNQKYQVWLAETLALSDSGGVHGAAVLVNSSTDGVTWANPVSVSIVEAGGYYDKPWIGCDNTSTSKYYGNCYVEFDDFSQGDLLEMSTSTDGGKTWSTKKTTAGSAFGTGGNPMVQPNGTVIVTAGDQFLSSVLAFTSTNGGASWSAPVTIAFISEHAVAGGMRALPLPNGQMDASGKAYVMWADCSFRSGCSANDIVYSSSTNGTTWSAVTRVPIDAVTSGIDHFTPGFGIKPGTSGSTAEFAVTYNFLQAANCSSSCELGVGIVTSTNGGATWGPARTLSKNMNPTWLPSTTSGQMAGDYLTVSFPSAEARVVFAEAKANVGSALNVPMETNQHHISAAAADEPQFSSANDKPVPNVHSQVHRTKPHRDDER